ncbi:LysE family transporter [Massilia sp. W12]|uniref:LysE family transporter n=1 Tax=Massilia sp. W12 TaxID=3126507 RepID=UPI0030CB52D2
MSFSLWLTFFVAACLIAVSPGSGAVLSMSHGLSYGVRKASGTILGLQAGLLLVLLIAGAGVGSLLLASETAFFAVKVTGALYLIFLGVMQWRAKVATDSSNPARVELGPAPDFKRRFLIGFFTNATNPKGILFMVAVLPQFIDQHAPVAPQLAILGVTMVSIDLVVMHGYAALAASLQGVMRNARAMRIQNRIFGSLLIGLGAGLFFVKRSTQAAA